MSQATVIEVGTLIDDQPPSAYQRSIMFWSCAVMFIEGYDMQVIAYAAPAIIKDWHLDRAQFGPVFGAGLFGYLLGATLLSGLADRFGRKKIVIAGSWLFGIFTLAAAYASTPGELLALRFIAGIGLGGSIPSLIALNAEYARRGTGATKISLLFLGYTVGGALGGFLAARLMPAFGWPSVFIVGGIAPLILGLLLVRVLPESVRFLALQQGRQRQIAAILRKLRPEIVIEPDTAFAVPEAPKAGLPATHLFREGRAAMTLLLWTAFIASLLGHHFLTSWLPTVLVDTGVPLAHAVIATALLQAGAAAGSLVIGGLVDRRGIAPIAILFAIAIPLVALIGASGLSEALLMTLLTATGVCLIGGQIGLNALSGTFYPTAIRSTGAGWAFGIGRIGSILGPVLGGMLISSEVTPATLFLWASVPVAAAALATGLLGALPIARVNRVRAVPNEARLSPSGIAESN